MEYGYDNTKMQGVSQPPDNKRVSDIDAIRERLSTLLGRANEANYRIYNLGDAVFGPRPSEGECGPECAPESITDFVTALEEVMSRIESGLSRFGQ